MVYENESPANSPRRKTVIRGSVRMRDVERYAQFCASIWDAIREQLTVGALDANTTFVSSDNSLAYFEATSASNHVRGMVPPGHVVVAVPVGTPGGRWWGCRYPSSSIAYAARPEEFDMVFPRGNKQIVVVVKEEVFHRQYEALSGNGPRFLEGKGHFISVSPQSVRRFEAEMMLLIGAANGNRQADFSPEAFDSRIMNAVVRALEPNSRLRGPIGSKRRIVEGALRNLEFSDGRMGLPDMCVSLDVSQGVLDAAFVEHMGVSAAGYLDLHRLNLGRKWLADSVPSSTSVEEIGVRLGFTEANAFASAYQELFGESPIATLNRGPRRVRAKLRFGVRTARGFSIQDLL